MRAADALAVGKRKRPSGRSRNSWAESTIHIDRRPPPARSSPSPATLMPTPRSIVLRAIPLSWFGPHSGEMAAKEAIHEKP
jgi:hypothetical protein